MNTPPEDENAVKTFEVTYRRPLRQFQWFVWVVVTIQFGLGLFLWRLHPPRAMAVAVAVAPAFILLLGVIGFLWWLAPRHPLVKQMRPAARHLGQRVAWAMLLYFVLFAAATWVYRHMHPTGTLAGLVALAPSLPILFAIRAMMLFRKEESDEFLRSRMLEGWAMATALTLAVCTVWGFLDQFEVVPHLPLWAAFPLWAGCLVPAYFLLQRREA